MPGVAQAIRAYRQIHIYRPIILSMARINGKFKDKKTVN